MKPRDPVPIHGRFAGQLVLITGAGHGIGAATASRFGAEGGFVLAADIDLPAAEGVAAAIREAGGEAESRELDQANERSVRALLSGHRESGLDVVCVNAGAVLLPLRPIEATDPLDWDRLHAVNLRGAYLVARATVPLLRIRGGGSIIFTASISGLRSHPGSAAYASSKAGLLGLSRSLAAEVGHDRIRVNCVCPGAVRTRMGGTDEELAAVARINPLERVAEPQDVAAAICFLASDDARHITAAELIVDGGIAAKVQLP